MWPRFKHLQVLLMMSVSITKTTITATIDTNNTTTGKDGPDDPDDLCSSVKEIKSYL